MEFEIARLSSKGQIVIPSNLRKDFKEGEKILVIRDRDRIILKKANKLDKNLEEDLEAAKEVEEAWKEIEQGKFKRMSAEDFLSEVRSFK